MSGWDRGRLGEVESLRLRRVDRPVHAPVAGIGAIVEAGDHVDHAVSSVEADGGPRPGGVGPLDPGAVGDARLLVVAPPEDVSGVVGLRAPGHAPADRGAVAVRPHEGVEAPSGAVAQGDRHAVRIRPVGAHRHAAVVVAVVHVGAQGTPQHAPVVRDGPPGLLPQHAALRRPVVEHPPPAGERTGRVRPREIAGGLQLVAQRDRNGDPRATVLQLALRSLEHRDLASRLLQGDGRRATGDAATDDGDTTAGQGHAGASPLRPAVPAGAPARGGSPERQLPSTTDPKQRSCRPSTRHRPSGARWGPPRHGAIAHRLPAAKDGRLRDGEAREVPRAPGSPRRPGRARAGGARPSPLPQRRPLHRCARAHQLFPVGATD